MSKNKTKLFVFIIIEIFIGSTGLYFTYFLGQRSLAIDLISGQLFWSPVFWIGIVSEIGLSLLFFTLWPSWSLFIWAFAIAAPLFLSFIDALQPLRMAFIIFLVTLPMGFYYLHYVKKPRLFFRGASRETKFWGENIYLPSGFGDEKVLKSSEKGILVFEITYSNETLDEIRIREAEGPVLKSSITKGMEVFTKQINGVSVEFGQERSSPKEKDLKARFIYAAWNHNSKYFDLEFDGKTDISEVEKIISAIIASR